MGKERGRYSKRGGEGRRESEGRKEGGNEREEERRRWRDKFFHWGLLKFHTMWQALLCFLYFITFFF